MENNLSKFNIDKIVIFSIDSIYSILVMNELIPEYKDRISLICLSNPYKKKSFLNQIKNNYKKSGIHFVNYLFFVFFYYKIILLIFGFFNIFLSPQKRILSIKSLTKKNNIEVITVSNVNCEEVEKKIKLIKPDLAISIYFDQLIRENIFTIPKFNTVNIHPGVLPDFRGPFPTFWKIYNKIEKFGVTSHFVDNKFDTGDIIVCEKMIIKNKRSVLGADYYIFKKVVNVVKKTINLFESDKIKKVRYKQKNGNYFSFPEYYHVSYLRKNLKIKMYTFSDFFKFFFK